MCDGEGLGLHPDGDDAVIGLAVMAGIAAALAIYARSLVTDRT